MTAIDIPELILQAGAMTQFELEQNLRRFSDYYHNDQSLIPDEVYDQLVGIYETKYGPYEYVGADPRGKKVDLPYYLGSLKKLKTASELDTWSQNYRGPYILEDKIDGLTLLIMYRSGRAVGIYTRGGGYQGLDVSHLINYIPLPTWTPDGDRPEELDIRGEIVMTRDAFDRVGQDFKNARNLTSGIVNSKKSFNPILARELSFYPYQILNSTESVPDQIGLLQFLGFNVPSPVLSDTISLDMLTSYLNRRKDEAPYEIDGLVLYSDVVEEYPEGSNPKHVVAFKTETETAITTVTDVVWEPSKDRLLKPVVLYKPVVLSGATLHRASGYNGRFITLNTIGPGAEILITRSGDVIPKIISILRPAPEIAWPDPNVFGAYEWNENEVELVLIDDNSHVRSKQLEYFLEKLGIQHMGPARVKTIVDSGIETISQLLAATPEQFAAMPGIGMTLAHQLYTNLQHKIKNVPLPTIMAASGFFPGIGVRRFQMIVDQYPNLYELGVEHPDHLAEYVRSVRGFKDLADDIAGSFPDFVGWLHDHPSIVVAKPIIREPLEEDGLAGMKIVFSGFRDADLQRQIEERGGNVTTSVSGNTSVLIAKDPYNKTGKLVTAEKKGIPIMSRDQFVQSYM